MRQVIELRRDVPGTLIPYGHEVKLNGGSKVELVQTLGGNFTVGTESGRLVRIASKDADALGLEGMVQAQATGEGAVPKGEPKTVDEILNELRTIFDPEIPINIVDLGLIYGCEVQQTPDGQRVDIQMSMTAPGCGMGDVLREDVREKLLASPGIAEAYVQIVWDPPWDHSRMSEAAKLQLGWL